MNQLVSKQYFRNALKDLEPVRQPLTSVQSSCNPYKGILRSKKSQWNQTNITL